MKYTLTNGEIVEGTPEEIQELIKIRTGIISTHKETMQVKPFVFNSKEFASSMGVPEKKEAKTIERPIKHKWDVVQDHVKALVEFLDKHPKKQYAITKAAKRAGFKLQTYMRPEVLELINGKVYIQKLGFRTYVSSMMHKRSAEKKFVPREKIVPKEDTTPKKVDKRVFRMKFMAQKRKTYFAQGLSFEESMKRASEDYNSLYSPLNKKNRVPKPTKPFVEFESVDKEFHVILEGILRNAIKQGTDILPEEVSYPLDLKTTARINNFFAELVQKLQQVSDYFGVPNKFTVNRRDNKIVVSYKVR